MTNHYKNATNTSNTANIRTSAKARARPAKSNAGFVNHDAVLSMLQGGSIYGLNMSINEGLTIKDGRIVEGNYNQYPMVRMRDIPILRVHFGGLSNGERYSEAGEPPVGPIGPAIAGAIYAATGKRIRQTPFRKQDLRWT